MILLHLLLYAKLGKIYFWEAMNVSDKIPCTCTLYMFLLPGCLVSGESLWASYRWLDRNYLFGHEHVVFNDVLLYERSHKSYSFTIHKF